MPHAFFKNETCYSDLYVYNMGAILKYTSKLQYLHSAAYHVRLEMALVVVHPRYFYYLNLNGTILILPGLKSKYQKKKMDELKP